MMNILSECDVLLVVVAAGIASLLAQQQRHVVVLEKERFRASLHCTPEPT
jgi:hypothetical protein